MLKLLKNSSIYTLQNKLTGIYILNTLDILFTISLLKTGLFQEANALMINIVDNNLLSILIKLILPALLIIYVIVHLGELPDGNLKVCNFFINIVLIIYTTITVLHVLYTFFFAYTLL